MHNMMYLIGKLNSEIQHIDDGIIIEIRVRRQFKDDNGEYNEDILPINVYGAMVEATEKYLKIGDLVGIKGTIRENDGKIELVADKLSFLATKGYNEE